MFCLSEYVPVGLLVVPEELGNILIKERQQYTFTLHDIFVIMNYVFRDWNLLSVLKKNYLLEYIYIKSLKIYGFIKLDKWDMHVLNQHHFSSKAISNLEGLK